MKPTRQRWLLLVVGLLANSSFLAIVARGWTNEPMAMASPANRRPNVLFIAVDDLNDWIGALAGHPQTQTPYLDQLAQRGVLFSNAHCAAPLCNPSRTATLLGLSPATTGILGNEQDWRQEPQVRDRPTLPHRFAQAGYWTGACGKIFHANHGGECGAWQGGHGGRQGFDPGTCWSARYPSRTLQLPLLPVPTGRNFNGLDIWHWDWGPIDVPEAVTEDGRAVDWAIQQLQPQPFFLAVGLYKPHSPWYVPKEYFDRFPLASIQLPTVLEDDIADLPAIAIGYLKSPQHEHHKIVHSGLWPAAVQAYLANIAFTDAQIGKLLTALDQSQHAHNTIIVLWSDHGWHLGEKQRWHKSTLWERATRVPLIVVAPGVTQPHTICQQPVSLLDLYPTLLELTGQEADAQLDGISLVPWLRQPDQPRSQPASTLMGTAQRLHVAVRTKRWRYIRYADGAEELYDHDHDPNEWINCNQQPEMQPVLAELRRWLPNVARPEKDNQTPGNNQPGLVARPTSAPVWEHSAAYAEPGFRPIFNGYNWASWHVAGSAWQIHANEIVGTAPIAAEQQCPTLTWQGREPTDFELRFQYRFELVQKPSPLTLFFRRPSQDLVNPSAASGYQLNLFENEITLIETVGRNQLAQGFARQVHRADAATEPESGRSTKTLNRANDSRQWHDLTLQVRGWTIRVLIDGQLILTFTEPNTAGPSKGCLGFQLPVGSNLRVACRHLRLRD